MRPLGVSVPKPQESLCAESCSTIASPWGQALRSGRSVSAGAPSMRISTSMGFLERMFALVLRARTGPAPALCRVLGMLIFTRFGDCALPGAIPCAPKPDGFHLPLKVFVLCPRSVAALSGVGLPSGVPCAGLFFALARFGGPCCARRSAFFDHVVHQPPLESTDHEAHDDDSDDLLAEPEPVRLVASTLHGRFFARCRRCRSGRRGAFARPIAHPSSPVCGCAVRSSFGLRASALRGFAQSAGGSGYQGGRSGSAVHLPASYSHS